MNLRTCWLPVLLALSLIPGAAAAAPEGTDIAAIARVPMLDNGRIKPFDTYARESIRFLTGSEVFQGRDPVALILDFAFDFKKWSDVPVISIDFLPLKEKLGVKREVKFLAASELANNKAYNDLLEQVRKSGKEPDKLPRLEKEAVVLYHRLSILENQVDGQGWKLVPHETDPGAAWAALSETKDEALKAAISAMSAAFVKSDAAAFNKAAGELASRLKTVSKLPYPEAKTIDREVWYHKFRPFEKASILYGLAFLAFLACNTVPPRRMYKLAVALALSGFAVHAYGIGLRVLISGRPPVSNVYETMLWVPFGINMFALIFELVHRARFFGLSATLLGAGILTLSDFVSLDPYVSPLVPVLRSNYWLIIHVLTITLGYAAATLCLGLAHLWLAVFVINKGSAPSLKNIEKYLYHAIQVTVLFIGTGTILGGVWANQSWGRYWGWDPKETWALISLLGYLAIVHARIVNAIGGFGTTVAAILAWQNVLFCWYGVNYFLVGLHSYAGGDQAGYIPWQVWVWAAFEAAILFVGWTSYKAFKKKQAEE
ncbi:MAG: cytochrome c biogenesis protein CcsA [Candidatus Wallbacteria bacterium]|nr:cytochrome c biogenesis protein CcsA [Candidatus Wallbacteria bacterium]